MVLEAMTQPMTVAQLATVSSMTLNRSCDNVRMLRDAGYVDCLNSSAKSGRVHWLTQRGLRAQQIYFRRSGSRKQLAPVPDVDWALYGRVCSAQRSIVIRTLKEPMQPATIKRRAFARDPSIRMSANNARDVIYFLLKRGVVEAVAPKRGAHSQYQLTALGRQFQMLLSRVR